MEIPWSKIPLVYHHGGTSPGDFPYFFIHHKGCEDWSIYPPSPACYDGSTDYFVVEPNHSLHKFGEFEDAVRFVFNQAALLRVVA